MLTLPAREAFAGVRKGHKLRHITCSIARGEVMLTVAEVRCTKQHISLLQALPTHLLL